MPNPNRAHFKFEMDREITIDTSRNLHRMAGQHFANSVQFSHSAFVHLADAQRWLRLLDHAQRRSMDADLFTEESIHQANRDREELGKMLVQVEKLVVACHALSNRMVDEAVAFEEEHFPFFSVARNRVTRRGTPKTEAHDPVLQVVEEVVLPHPAQAAAPPAPSITLPEDLLLAAAHEIATKAQQESQENRL